MNQSPHNTQSQHINYGTSVRNHKTRFTPKLHHNLQAKKIDSQHHIKSLKDSLKDTLKAAKKEQFVLKASMYSALALAIFGITFGILVKSMAVIFDGFVALISVGLGALSVVTSRYIYKEDDDIFQYGYVDLSQWSIFSNHLCLFLSAYMLLLMPYKVLLMVAMKWNLVGQWYIACAPLCFVLHFLFIPHSMQKC